MDPEGILLASNTEDLNAKTRTTITMNEKVEEIDSSSTNPEIRLFLDGMPWGSLIGLLKGD
ncbi:hypothetical protein LEP1GSC050_2271 [Leptospira broomii serovar Hurstbridge str. 5399]|uniref:Uncharacterized protein n=1 Tax=Leptospira broomii serovar Hurstbridge str. 5399 TaxID=1049789 RepID=T0GLI4_9LEPT|nr:hypothetical protein LEP1GSC050_2271 [Leptospira broomii serovar Hurstbridge str. 5399]